MPQKTGDGRGGAPKPASPSYPPLRDTDAALRKPVATLLSLIKRINDGHRPRGENELSRRLADVVEALHITTTVDTSPRGTKKRPDILGYRSKRDANLGLHADVVVESKLPNELPGVDIVDALVNHLWDDKTFPYIAKNLHRIQYFILTNFVEYACVRITDQIRRAFAEAIARNATGGASLRALVAKHVERLSLAGVGSSKDRASETRWLAWLDTHLRRLDFVPISTIADTVKLKSREDLEEFATHLALVAAGPENAQRGDSDAGLFTSLRALILNDEKRARALEKDLRLFVMSQNPSVDASAAARLISDDRARWIDEFIAASIHSLISRLFALKVIEDVYCVGEEKPLIEESLWVIHTTGYDALTPDALRDEVTGRMRRLVDSSNSLVQRMAVFGAFFEWINDQIDPVIFRALFELFVVHDFRELEGDLLGRFFEVYSQRINRAGRKELGQYYTPLAVIRYMWSAAIEELKALGLLDRVTVLDPSTGSGAFLSEGARRLAEMQVPTFWERLVGFDVSPQVLGIAQVNLYMAVLSQLSRPRASDVSDLRIYTTDTLDPRNGKHLQSITPFFEDEAHRAFLRRSIEVSAQIKQQQHFWLVIGNPPYKNNSAFTLTQMAERFPKLLRAASSVAKSQERYIRDDYAWFFAAADHYVQGHGMIVYITSDSFLRHASYTLFRRELLRHYRVKRVLRLGEGLFQDVGPNISFVITILLRRREALADEVLDRGSDEATVAVQDLRALSAGALSSVVGSDQDPRLLCLDAASRNEKALPASMSARPSKSNGYALVPIESSALDRMRKDAVPLASGKNDRIFDKKWSGIITAFDELLKDESSERLQQRMFRFLSICQAERRNPDRLRSRVTDFAREHGIKDEMGERLLAVASRAAELRTVFDPSKIKRSVSGSIPNGLRWYPPPQYRHFIYFEPSIKIARNDNPGKAKGWGSMEQWRDPVSHCMTPKLIFTSSTNPKYGYKAFVVDDEWYAKLHGGKSQQYNYTGLFLPSGSAQMTTLGAEANLWDSGVRLRRMFVAAGRQPAAVLHYISGIYNSAFAETWLSAETGQELLVKTPKSVAGTGLALAVSDMARDLRDLHRLLYDGPKEGRVERAALEALASDALLRELGLVWTKEGGKRFRQTEACDLPVDLIARFGAKIAERQRALDEAVEKLYD